MALEKITILVNNGGMGIFSERLCRVLWLTIVSLLLWGGVAVFSGERGKKNLQHEYSEVFDLYAQGHGKESFASQAKLVMHAQLINDSENITEGLVWRVYSSVMESSNELPLVASFEGGSAHFDLEAGSYVIHVSFGRASLIRRVNLEGGQRLVENFNLNAGGVILDSGVLDGKVNEKELHFAIYESTKAMDDTDAIVSNIRPKSLVRLKAGYYHVVSYYGSVNAVIRSDIQVEAGQITEATLQHQAAQILLKLVRQEGGEALADTSWSVINNSGDIIYETVGPYVSLVLAEGDYIAIAKNKEQIYQKDFSVTSGRDEDVSVIADVNSIKKVNEAIN
ncbi:carboxypeptidase regulatory-like domain-containing protein [Bartonella ancashensis]|uniref:carboxypeptidase regulatory-like domain-containing protein n=1 Tax=Bartonella ancashensis TaxID=1318743 RepID=UPI0011877237|nr:carboxypeptidase regulatory-like domain-containing protein [Bartonella ancashensis]